MGRGNFCFTGDPPYNQYVYVDFPSYVDSRDPARDHEIWWERFEKFIHDSVVPNMPYCRPWWFHTGGDSVQVKFENGIIQIGFADCEVYAAVIVMGTTDACGEHRYPNLVKPHVDRIYKKLLRVLYEAGYTELHTSGGGYTSHLITKEMIYG